MRYHGKYESPRKGRPMPKVAALSLALVLLVSVGGTLAFLLTTSNEVVNTFAPANLYAEVQETFNGTTKSNVKVYNGYTDGTKKVPSEAPVYIRVALVPTWEDENGNAVPLSASLTDFVIALGSSKWVLGYDGYYYYTERVAAGGTTEVLIETATVDPNSEGYKAGYQMNLQILAETIQADPSNAAKDAWKVDPTTGKAVE